MLGLLLCSSEAAPWLSHAPAFGLLSCPDQVTQHSGSPHTSTSHHLRLGAGPALGIHGHGLVRGVHGPEPGHAAARTGRICSGSPQLFTKTAFHPHTHPSPPPHTPPHIADIANKGDPTLASEALAWYMNGLVAFGAIPQTIRQK